MVSNMFSVLKLVLSAPLQSYGIDSRWDSRDTNSYPTKSAIVGMLGSAFGYQRGDNRLDILNDNISVNIRVDKPGYRLEDLQVVNWDVKAAQGGKRKGKGDAHPLLYKYYIQDAIFTVYISSNEDLINEIYSALKNPVWPIYLGRKSCTPTYPILSEPPVHGVTDIKTFIVNSSIILEDRVIEGFLKENRDSDKIWFDMYLEDSNGLISLYDSFSSKGYYDYKLRKLTKESFYKEIEYNQDGNCYVFK